MRSLLLRWMLAVAIGCGWGAATSSRHDGAGAANAKKWAFMNSNSQVNLVTPMVSAISARTGQRGL